MGQAPSIPFDAERELEELKAYLGPGYDHERLVQWEAQLEAEHRELGHEGLLYRTSEGYLYNLTAFAMSATKLPYLELIARSVEPGARLLDYGCGIGSDGLCLIEAGYRVAFADFDNPSVRYLRWRLEHRGLEAEIFDLDAGGPPGGFELAYAFDVIEHVDDPFAFLTELERRARLVLVNLLEPRPDEPASHRALPIAELLEHATRRGIRHYRRYWGRSHLVLYESNPARLPGRLRSRLRLLEGRLRS